MFSPENSQLNTYFSANKASFASSDSTNLDNEIYIDSYLNKKIGLVVHEKVFLIRKSV